MIHCLYDLYLCEGFLNLCRTTRSHSLLLEKPWPTNHPVQLESSAPAATVAALVEIAVLAALVVALVARPLLAETFHAPAARVPFDVLFDTSVPAARKAALVAAQPVRVESPDALAVHAKPAALAALAALNAFDAPVAGARTAALVVAQPVLGEVLDVPAVLLAFDAPGAAARMAAPIAAHPVLVE